jgi:hypothetical protein
MEVAAAFSRRRPAREKPQRISEPGQREKSLPDEHHLGPGTLEGRHAAARE